jgi:excisionase family DNA binding protein
MGGTSTLLAPPFCFSDSASESTHIRDLLPMTTSGAKPLRTQRLAHSPPHAAELLDTNVRAVYTYIANGELKSFKLGKRRLIPDAELQRLIQRKLAEAA